MSDNPILTAVAIARHVESLLPPIDHMLGHLEAAEHGLTEGLGPAVTIPAIYLHIIIQAWEAETLERQRKEMQDVIDNASRKPAAPMSDDDFTALSIHLAKEARAMSHDPMEGASSLWKAAAIIAVTQMQAMQPDDLLNALDGIHAMTRADVAQAIGKGATKQ